MSYEVSDAYSGLAAAIILNAYKETKQRWFAEKIPEFYNSHWFECLCDICDMDCEKARKKFRKKTMMYS